MFDGDLNYVAYIGMHSDGGIESVEDVSGRDGGRYGGKCVARLFWKGTER